MISCGPQATFCSFRKNGGYDTFIVSQWLLHEVEQNALPVSEELKMPLWSSNHMLSIWTNGGWWLTPEELMNVEQAGKLFMRSYLSLAREALRCHRLRYRCRPKIHLLQHMYMRKGYLHVNPAVYATWLDEDGLKKLMATLGKLDPRTAPTRVLQRWLMGLPSVWQELRQQ